MVLILAVLAVALAGVARGQVVTEFPIPTAFSAPTAITAGPDGNLWFTEESGDQIARITAAGLITEFPVPAAECVPTPCECFPHGIAAGPDGNLWFTEGGCDKIARITTAGVITEFPVSTADSGLLGIAAGPDGNLWFTEFNADQIGRITTTGVITQYSIPSCCPGGNTVGPAFITAGPDGNVWFTEGHANKIGRITTAGVITEFPVSMPLSGLLGIVAGLDGNLWFTEWNANQIGRITTAGVIAEFPIPTADREPVRIAAGPDGNLWFTEDLGNQIGRITTAGVITEFPVPLDANNNLKGLTGIAAGPDGSLWFTEVSGNQVGRITTGPTTPQDLAVDTNAVVGSISNLNGVLESGETVQVAPTWTSTLTMAQSLVGIASNLLGPAGPTYTINDDFADYGSVTGGARSNCASATGDCYLMTVGGTRPSQHWDATFNELVAVPVTPATTWLPLKTWTLHVGESFPDVPTSNPYYPFIENLLHNGIPGGCGGGMYCPADVVTRSQMAVMLMKAKLGATQLAPPATGTVFGDVPASNPFAPWIEQLAGFAITVGCGGGNYCPDGPVTRAQMAVLLLRAEHGSAYTPPGCSGIFTDVECTPTSAFAVNWIEQLYNDGVTGGCGGGMYCPAAPVNRGQIAVFLTKTFGLKLYGP
jgi:streptogramin lyase